MELCLCSFSQRGRCEQHSVLRPGFERRRRRSEVYSSRSVAENAAFPSEDAPHTTLVAVSVEDPQTTLNPLAVLLPQTTELPHTTELPVTFAPQTTDEPHTTEDPQTTDVEVTLPLPFANDIAPVEVL